MIAGLLRARTVRDVGYHGAFTTVVAGPGSARREAGMQVMCALAVSAATVMAADVWAAESPARERFKLDAGGKVIGLAVSGRGAVVAAAVMREGPELGALAVWRLTGEGPQRLRGAFEQPARAVAVSPDGRQLAITQGGGGVRLWTLADGREKTLLDRARPHHLAFAPDGKHLAGADYKDVRIWDANTGRLEVVLVGHLGDIEALTFSPGGGLLATGGSLGDATVRLWEPSGRQRKVLGAFTRSADAVSISADEMLVAAAGEGADAPVLVWDVSSGRRTNALGDPENRANCLSFSPSGELAIGWLDGSITIEDLRQSRPPVRLQGHERFVTAMAFTADGRTLVSGASDGTVRVWSVTPGGPPLPTRTPAHTSAAPWPPAVRVGGTLQEPRKIRDARPDYPDSAKKARVSGVVILEITIAPQGRVAEAKVIRGVHPDLDRAALDAVKDWVYEPTKVRGIVVPVIMTVTVYFRLE
jgi:TonB family protein